MRIGWVIKYHKQGPDSVVGEDGAGEDEHCEAYKAVELVDWVSDLVWFGVNWGRGRTGLLAPILEAVWFLVLICLFKLGAFLSRSIVQCSSPIHSPRFDSPPGLCRRPGQGPAGSEVAWHLIPAFHVTGQPFAITGQSNNNPLSPPPKHHPLHPTTHSHRSETSKTNPSKEKNKTICGSSTGVRLVPSAAAAPTPRAGACPRRMESKQQTRADWMLTDMLLCSLGHDRPARAGKQAR